MMLLKGDVTTVQPGSSFGFGWTIVSDARKYTELKRKQWMCDIRDIVAETVFYIPMQELKHGQLSEKRRQLTAGVCRHSLVLQVHFVLKCNVLYLGTALKLFTYAVFTSRTYIFSYN
jgi:hypothetical protein